MYEFRVTKYDPAFRAACGAYTRDQWTSITDIGQVFEGGVLTAAEYQRVEDAYAESAVRFMQETGVASLVVTGLEYNGGVPPLFGEGSLMDLHAAESIVRRVLREELWCRLEAVNGFLHFGWDYYLYIGVTRPCPAAETFAVQRGLFVEAFKSPYRKSSPT